LDIVQIIIDFSGESPGKKEAAIEVIGGGCLLIGIENLNATS